VNLADRSRHRQTEHGQGPATHRRLSENHAQRGGLACAIGSEQTETAAAGDGQVDAANDCPVAELLGQAAGDDDGIVGMRNR
jgi:hypothetical protein